jgi:hypothetical protein
VNATPKLVPYQPTLPAQIRPDLSLVTDRPVEDAAVAGSAGQPATASIGADGLRARRSAQSTLRPSAASHNRLVRTTQLGLSRG